MESCSPRPYIFTYPALRVTNPSLPTPPLEIVDREKTKRLPKANNRITRTQDRFRPPGYTSSGSWLRDGVDYDGPRRMISMAFPNPHELMQEREQNNELASYYSSNNLVYPVFEVEGSPRFTSPQLPGRANAVPSLMYNEGQERLRGGRALSSALRARAEMPLTRLQTPRMQTSVTSQANYLRALPRGNAYDMRLSHSQPASEYAPSLAHEQEREYEYPTARSTGVSSVVREHRPQTMVSRTSAGPASRPRTALQLGVHGLSLVDEEGASTFGPVVQNYYESPRAGSGSPMRALPSDNLTAWRPRAHRDSLYRLQDGQRSVVTRQPRGSRGMRVVVGNRNVKGLPYAENGTRDWSTDLCLFCDHNLGTCCKALWCPCIIYGRNKARIEHLYAEEQVHPAQGGTCSGDCAVHACLSTFCLFGWAIQIPNRAAVRRRYAIDGDWIGDCAAAFFCSACELAQESREIDLEEGSFAMAEDWTRRDDSLITRA